MAILGAHLSCKVFHHLQHRIFSIPWLKKNVDIASFKGIVYCSSVPVRYIPKKLRESQISSPPLSSSEEEDASKHSGSKASRIGVSRGGTGGRRTVPSARMPRNQDGSGNQISINGLMFDEAKQETLTFSKLEEEIEVGDIDREIMEDLEAFVEGNEIHEENDHHKRNVPQASKTAMDAEKLAIELLATRAFTVVELRKKLQGKKFPIDIIDEVINDFKSRGLINDGLYAETYSRSRWSSSSWGPRRIKQALMKKGISEVDVEKAVTVVFRDGESSGDQESGFGLSKLSMDHLFVQASKQWLRGKDAALEMRKSRIIRWLQYRGFNWGVISFILRRLESQYPPQSKLG
ncbi:uncharacterized protein LOC131167970 [Malania oleifera]|uniref:uncharacterized protein LOC131167970 n=1 Tax=Malania oleifera TaxID=397392 RepID=UPI0025AE4C81|nr:uncharacterized protein LOC131167970 [Malania oleifera]